MNGEFARHRHSGAPAPANPSNPGIHLTIPCYEGPEGRGPGVLELTEEALCRHVFVCGSTGSGKTTLLRAITRQLIAANARDATEKVGLVVLDFKGDRTVDQVRAAAAAVGREADVRVLSLGSDTAYDFFADCRHVSQATEYAERLLFGCGEIGGESGVFWSEFRLALLSASITWLVTLHGQDRSFTRWLSHASSWLLAEHIAPEQKAELDALRSAASGMPTGDPGRTAIEHAVRLIEDWDGGLDPRTRSNARATLHNALRPLLEEPVQRLFRSAAKRFQVASAVTRGRILVVSINAYLHPHLAALVARCVKCDFYRAVMSRRPGDGRLAMLIADEFQLAATSGSGRHADASALPLLREYRAGVVAATQTLIGLDRVIGPVDRRLLLANFNTIAFMHSSEAELEAFAEQACGMVETDVTIRESHHDSRERGFPVHGEERRITRRMLRPVCPRGTLARLQPGQAFLLRHGGEPCVHPVWIAEPPG